MKKILLTLLALIVFLVLGVVIFLLTFDLNHYRHLVETQASNALGRPVEIKSLATKLSLIPTIKVEGVRILDTNQTEPLLEVPKLEAVIELMPLIQKQIVVQKIEVPSATLVWAQTNSSKTTNSVKKEEKFATKEPTKSQKIWIDSVAIDTLQCKIGKEKPFTFKLNKITLKELSKFSFDFIYQEKTINVNGNFGSILEIATKKNELPINLTFAQDKASVKINGKIADLPNLKKINLSINANVPNLSALLKKWNIKGEKIPVSALTLKTSFDGDLEKAQLGNTTLTLGKSDLIFTTKGNLNNLKKNPSADLTGQLSLTDSEVSKLWKIKPFNLETKINANKNSISLTEIQLNAGRSDLTGRIQTSWEKMPLALQGELKSTYLDVYDILDFSKQANSGQASEKTKSRVFNTNKLPFDLLKQIDANVQLNVGHLKFSDEISDYAAVNSTISIKNAELSMPAQVRIFGGAIQNQLKIQAQKQKISLKTEGEGIQLDKMKRLSKNIRNSLLNFSLSLEAVGENLHQLASAAEGNISAELTSGQIINKWFNSLPTTLNLLKGQTSSLTFSTQDQKTELLCGAVNLPVRNGVIVSQNQIALETNTLNFVVNGRVDLKNESLNLTMIPSLSQTRGMANELLGAAQSITLSGPWNAIETHVNAGMAVENLMKTAVQKLAGQEQKTIKTQAKELCQKVLGRSVSKASQTTPKKQTTQKQTQVQPQQKKPDLKQQLIQSLSQALTDQVAPAKKQ